MKITIQRLTPWSLAKDLARTTISKNSVATEPTSEWKSAMLLCEHSPIRAVMYHIKLEDIPYFVSVHLVRHKFGVEHFVSSQRTDRTGEQRDNKRQDAPVCHEMIVNAAALIFMSRKRLCGLADLRTRKVWQAVKDCMCSIGEQEMANAMRPECAYRNGFCPEIKPCNKKG